MPEALAPMIRLIEDIFPASALWGQGAWRRIRPATAEERRRGGWGCEQA
mgnify:CR=1 FL=1